MAFARAGDGRSAVEVLQLLNPVQNTRTPEAVARYRGEPYVVAADVYALQGEEGRGGWTWYTGSSGWMYRVWLEEVIGFRLRGQTVMIDPVIPPDWKHFSVSYRYEETSYEMTVENPDAISRVFDRTDGARISTHFMQDDKEDTVRIRLVVTASQHKRR